MKFDVVEPASWMVIPHTLHEAVRLLPACTKSLKPNEITNGTAPAEPAAAMVCLYFKSSPSLHACVARMKGGKYSVCLRFSHLVNISVK